MNYQLRTELRRSGASGPHPDRRTKRARTRQSAKLQALRQEDV